MKTDYFEENNEMNIWHPDGCVMPEIISFTQLLQYLYTEDYASFIRRAYRRKALPIDYGSLMNKNGVLPEITEVEIIEGYFERMDYLSFSMCVVCEILFADLVTEQQFTLKVCVDGYHEFDDYTASFHVENKSNYFLGLSKYTEKKRAHTRNRLDEYLVPVLYKRNFDEYAYNFLERYCPEALDEDMKIDPELVVKRIGFNLRYETLSDDGSVTGTTVFRDKWVDTYTGSKCVKKHIAHNTVICSKKFDVEKRSIILHECIHILSHNLFYELQHYYRSLVSKYRDGRKVNFVKDKECSGLKWAEVQADAIPSHISMYYERVYDFVVNYRDKNERNVSDTDYKGLRYLIDSIASVYGVSRNSAKKRIVELGYKKARGVYEWGFLEYAEDFYVPDSFPDDHTYTISFYELSKAVGKNLLLDKFIFSGAFVYADGHLAVNDPKYIVQRLDRFYLTEYAKQNMSECCVPFRRVYGHRSYNYTLGELNKAEENQLCSYELDAGIKRSIDMEMQTWMTGRYYINNSGKNMSAGETVRYHMERLNINVEQLAEKTGLTERTIIALRTKKDYSPKIETVLAFMIGAGLEEVFRNDLLYKFNLSHQMQGETYDLYRVMTAIKPNISVHQINQYLGSIGKKPWTKTNVTCELPQFG